MGMEVPMSSTQTRIRWKRVAFAAGIVAAAIVVAPRAQAWASKWEETSANGDRQQVIEDLCSLRNDVDLYIATTGHYPETWSALKKTEAPLDPWGNPYRLVLRPPSGHLAIDSWGADGAPGGTGPNADWSDFKAKLFR
jgi:hypothetical protein